MTTAVVAGWVLTTVFEDAVVVFEVVVEDSLVDDDSEVSEAEEDSSVFDAEEEVVVLLGVVDASVALVVVVVLGEDTGVDMGVVFAEVVVVESLVVSSFVDVEVDEVELTNPEETPLKTEAIPPSRPVSLSLLVSCLIWWFKLPSALSTKSAALLANAKAATTANMDSERNCGRENMVYYGVRLWTEECTLGGCRRVEAAQCKGWRLFCLWVAGLCKVVVVPLTEVCVRSRISGAGSGLQIARSGVEFVFNIGRVMQR